MTPFQKDYDYYKAKLAKQQADSDATLDWLGFPRVDLAHAKAVEREQARRMPSSEAMLRQFREDLALRKYAQAIGQ